MPEDSKENKVHKLSQVDDKSKHVGGSADTPVPSVREVLCEIEARAELYVKQGVLSEESMNMRATR